MADNEGFDLPRWHNPSDMQQYATPAYSASSSLSRSTSLRDGSSNTAAGYPSPPSPGQHLDPYATYNTPPQQTGNYYPRYPHARTQSQGLLSPLSSPQYQYPDTATHSSQPSSPVYSPMTVDKHSEQGFRRVRYPQDLRPNLHVPPYVGRPAMDNTGAWLGPLSLLTTNLVQTYARCNPSFHYESTHNPRRVLTKPSKPAHNEGYDNEDYDYILYVNDWLGVEEGHKYLILDILGQGTFGQVVKCQNMKTHEIVAVKVVKNKPAYFNQSMMEVTILDLLNKNADPNDQHHILRLRDSFIHRSHLCLVFELLSSNLYELIKQNQFQGLSTQLVKVFMAQLLDALTVLKEQRLIHCDLKPENILLKSLQSPQIKVIDFGSACHEQQTVYTYIQSRFYRSPEVLLGMPYSAGIDMWSLGCIAVELFLGLPLFPGTSEYNQLTRILDMLGMPPLSMLNQGKQTQQFFDGIDVYNPHLNVNEKKYRLKPIDQYSREHGTNEQAGKQYFKARTLPDIINQAPMPPSSSSHKKSGGNDVEREINNRASFIDFCKGLLDMNPVTRWSPVQARQHPFITGDKFVKPYVPGAIQSSPKPSVTSSSSPPAPPQQPQDPKRPYGGLVPSQPQGKRAYQDAATYNQHLSQHQVYTAQQQQQQQTGYGGRNPYMTGTTSSSASSTNPATATTPSRSQPQTPSIGLATSAPPFPQPLDTAAYAPPPTAPAAPGVAVHRLPHQSSHGQLATTYSAAPPPHLNPPSINVSASAGVGSGPASAYPGNPASATGAYYTPQQAQQNRGRANTIGNNTQAPMDIPPALARLQHMNADVLQGGRNALTPVLNRDDAMREWERRQQQQQQTRVNTNSSMGYHMNPQLDYLAQQADLVQSNGMNWNQMHASSLPTPVRYPQQHPQQPSKLAYATSAGGGGEDVSMADGNRRDVVMSNVRAAAAAASGGGGPPVPTYRGPSGMSGSTSGVGGSAVPPPSLVQSPPQAYNATASGPQAAARGGYAPPTAAQQYAQSVLHHQQTPFDSPGGSSATLGSPSGPPRDLYLPMQPEQYGGQPGSGPGSVVPGSVVAQGPYATTSPGGGTQPLPPPGSAQQQRRQSGMEWGR